MKNRSELTAKIAIKILDNSDHSNEKYCPMIYPQKNRQVGKMSGALLGFINMMTIVAKKQAIRNTTSSLLRTFWLERMRRKWENEMRNNVAIMPMYMSFS